MFALPDAIRRRAKALSRIVPGLLAAVMVVGLMELGAWASLERLANSELVRWRGPRLWDSRIVMVSIDDKTLGELGQFPISREYYAELVRLLAREDASIVVFNMLFSDNVIPVGGAADRQANARLAAEMAAYGRVVIGQAWGAEPESTPIQPVPVLAETAIATGHLRLPVDPDGITRFAEVSVRGVPTLGIAAAQVYSLNQTLIDVPTELKRLEINWPSSARDLATLSFVDVLNGQFPPTYLKDKIIIVGYGATAGKAPMRTPFDAEFEVQGGYMHAAVIDNVLNQNWLRPVPTDITMLALLLIGPLFNVWTYRRSLTAILLAGGALSGGWLLLCVVGLKLSLSLPVVPPLVTVWATGLSVLLVERIRTRTLLQVRSAFLNTMSHEIRTPLNAIVNLSELLQETPLNRQQQEYAETLHNSSQTLLALINDVLDFSKIEAGQLMIEEYPVTLSDVIERSLELVAPRAAEKALELVYSIAPETPPTILSDPVRLQQILLNLLSNAVKFTESGQVAVQVTSEVQSIAQPLCSLHRPTLKKWMKRIVGDRSLRHTTAHRLPATPRYTICFQVSDTGIGIAANQVSQLFKPFSQVSASTSRQYGGTGLGLSISQRLSERLGGALWVKSQPGKGSRFYFTVQAPATQTPEAEVLRPLEGLRVLLIEPNNIRREWLAVELDRWQVTAIVASSVPEALTQLQTQQNQPAVGLSCMILDEAACTQTGGPNIVLATLRRATNTPRLPVILLSALKSEVSEGTAGICLLWKPIKRAALYRALRSLPSRSPILSLPPSPAPAASEEPLRDPAPLKASLKILIAEDNSVNQRVALRLLELMGHTADVANAGPEVLTALHRQPYDAVLMDMRMPGQDGLETTRQIRSDFKLPAAQRGVWIIAMTANTLEEDRRRCLAAGMDDFLTKPIKRAALAQALQRCPAMRSAKHQQGDRSTPEDLLTP